MRTDAFFPLLHSEPNQPGLVATLAHGLSRLATAWNDMRDRSAAMDELTHLSDHELADLGLTRCAIPFLFGSKRR